MHFLFKISLFILLIQPKFSFSNELEKQACFKPWKNHEIDFGIKHCLSWLQKTTRSQDKIEALQTLASLYLKNNDVQEANKNIEEALSYLKLDKKVDYLKHWVEIQEIKAIIALENGEIKNSDAIYRITLYHLKYRLGEEDDLYSYFAEKYVQFLIEFERYAEAKDWLNSIILKSSTSRSLKAKYNLALLFVKTRQDHAAEENILDLIKISNDLENKEEIKADIYQLAGYFELEKANLNQAQKYIKTALTMREKMYFGRHIKIAESLASLGSTLAKLRKKTEAEQYLSKAYGIFRDLKGEEDPQTKAILNEYKELIGL